MNLEKLKEQVCKARTVFEAHGREISDIYLGRFPCCACRAASDILGTWLTAHGYDNVTFVSGLRGEEPHAWLEMEGLIVDITADQFIDGPGRIYIGADKRFHDQFGLQATSECCLSSVFEAPYRAFAAYMESTLEFTPLPPPMYAPNAMQSMEI
ncbi:hypothetical protein HCH_05494 [Hahella chejuensis KCTC 2396]|uniref:Uncharacterized protein n=1 Tax=Hahella chejuensis (strain KCTC 2396) TaxID=349521 RepID=Q2SB17_HAHCH|nr:hypothetical protein [Hahella chejuensis]ABC32157.1 hypothetical protein HCH_05494 [Hahella chejuensis KCTC 2396]